MLTNAPTRIRTQAATHGAAPNYLVTVVWSGEGGLPAPGRCGARCARRRSRSRCRTRQAHTPQAHRESCHEGRDATDIGPSRARIAAFLASTAAAARPPPAAASFAPACGSSAACACAPASASSASAEGITRSRRSLASRARLLSPSGCGCPPATCSVFM